jgi:hypothetical protein
VLVPLAPATTVLDRFRTSVEAVFGAHGLNPTFIDAEVAQMAEYHPATTKNRSVIGIMNEFARLGRAYRDSEDGVDLHALSMWLACTPCRPLYSPHVTPDRELAEFVARRNSRPSESRAVPVTLASDTATSASSTRLSVRIPRKGPTARYVPIGASSPASPVLVRCGR